MKTRQRKKTFLHRFLLPVFAISFLSYFGFHTFQGTYGLVSYQQFRSEIVRLETQLAALQRVEDALLKQETLLAHGSPDRETIDEFARKKLNVARPDEVVVFVGHN